MGVPRSGTCLYSQSSSRGRKGPGQFVLYRRITSQSTNPSGVGASSLVVFFFFFLAGIRNCVFSPHREGTDRPKGRCHLSPALLACELLGFSCRGLWFTQMQEISYVWIARLTHISVESDVPAAIINCLCNTRCAGAS